MAATQALPCAGRLELPLPAGPHQDDAQAAYGAVGLAQLSRALEQVTMADANAHMMMSPVPEQQSHGPAGQEPSSSEAGCSAYSSSESSSAGDNQVDPSFLDSYVQSSNGSTLQQRGSQEGKAQICFDFTKGVCTRGDKCKYSHDLATIVHFNSKEKGICFDYLRNQCHRGLLCRFSHDLSNIAQQCQVYTNPKENKGGKPNAICYDFVKGVCQRGAECRYSHDLSLIARMARGGNTQQKAAEVCYDYLRGRCNRGATCKYSHNISFLAAPGFLGSAIAADGTPIAATTGGPNGLPNGNGPMSGGSFTAMPPLPGVRSLAGAISADQATLSALAAQVAAQNHMGPMVGAEGIERRRRSMTLPGEHPDASGFDHQGWGPASSAAKAIVQAQLQFAVQQQQRMQAAGLGAAAGPYGPMQGAAAPNGTEALLAAQAASGMFAMPRPGMMHFAPNDAGAGHGMPAIPPMARPTGLPPLPPSAAAMDKSAVVAALLSAMPHDNPNMLAEALSMHSAAASASAQAHHQAQVQVQAAHARYMAANAAANAMMPPGPMMAGMPPAVQGPPQGSVPQAIPGRESNGYDMDAYGNAMYQNGPGSAAGMQEQLSRSAPAGPGGVINPDLLPMIKEIWSKPGGQ